MSKHNEIPAYTLFTMPSNRLQRRSTFIIGLIIAVLTLLCVPFARLELPKSNTFLPTLLGTVVCFEWMTIFVFYNQFRIHRSPQILVLCAGYAYTSLMTLAYLILFPGFFPPTYYTPGNQTAEYLYVYWHAGFPVTLLIYTTMERWFGEVRWSAKQALRGTVLLGVGVVGIVACFVYVSVAFEKQLPNLVNFGLVSRLFTFGYALPIMVLSCAAFVFYYRLTRAGTVTSAWLCVALLVNVLDVGIVLWGGNRFSLGWYVSKFHTFLFANIVLAALFYEFIQMYVKMTGLYDQSRKAGRKIAEQNKIIERMLVSSHEAITMCDTRGVVVFANGRFEELFGRPLSIGDSLVTYVQEMKLLNGGMLAEEMFLYFEKTQAAFREYVAHQASDGEASYYECHVTPIRDEGTTTFYGHLIAFGNRTEAIHKAHNDELTGLPNRRYIGEWLERRASMQEAGADPYAVLFLDLDGFKQVNDTLGHERGDKLLQEVAAALKRCTDEPDIVARWAGDEFVILVERVEHVDLDQLADRVLSAVRHIDVIMGHPVAISGSLGIALGNEAGIEAKTILHQADQAMYEAKSKGKNRYCFYSKTV
ncbi:diguanylate cyclase domain-containing protein [Paenibacillus koleovorans]|uniref:diguanylate cyclase domain-containing protein n=1 Tax=Paenibacillus koleovorans TaxID=121608 RepID=UPI0013E2CC97|nr:diguanylate cyclase [Paenibacillus koleovorans]